MMRAVVLDGPPYPDQDTTFVLVPDENLVTGARELARQVGHLTSLEEDLVTLAAAIFAIDLAAKRGEREDIVRDLHLSLPVVNHHAFMHLTDDLSNILYILSHDNWTVEFTRKAGTPENTQSWPEHQGKTLLFSGGLDSLAGAVEELEGGSALQMVSHYTGNPVTRGCQNRLFTYLDDTFPGQATRVSVKATGRNRGILPFPSDDAREPTQRTRSFMFLVLGAIAARRKGYRDVVMIAENGQMAIHLPLTAARIGAFSTHTAHPEFVYEMQQFLGTILSYDLTIENPFLYRTKAECVVRLVAAHARAIEDSVSCWKSSRQTQRHCGICIPCLIRRIALEHQGITLHEYARDLLAEDISALPPDDTGKRNFSELVEFMTWFGGTYPDAAIEETFPELISERFDKIRAVSMYRRFAREARGVLSRYLNARRLIA